MNEHPNPEGTERAQRRVMPQSRRQLRHVFTLFSLAMLLATFLNLVLAIVELLLPKPVRAVLGSGIPSMLWSYVMVFLPALIVFPLLLRKYPMASKEELPVRWPHPSVKQIVVCFLFNMGAVYLAGFVQILLSLVLPTADAASAVTPASGVLILEIVDTAILTPIVEEYMFRRLYQDRLMFLGQGAAILFTAFFFALYHLELSRYLYTFVGALIFGYIHARTGKMRWNILLHMGTNLMSIVMTPLGAVPTVLLALALVVFAIVYAVIRRPWRDLPAKDSPIPSKEKWIACFTSVPFYLSALVLLGLMSLLALLS